MAEIKEIKAISQCSNSQTGTESHRNGCEAPSCSVKCVHRKMKFLEKKYTPNPGRHKPADGLKSTVSRSRLNRFL